MSVSDNMSSLPFASPEEAIIHSLRRKERFGWADTFHVVRQVQEGDRIWVLGTFEYDRSPTGARGGYGAFALQTDLQSGFAVIGTGLSRHSTSLEGDQSVLQLSGTANESSLAVVGSAHGVDVRSVEISVPGQVGQIVAVDQGLFMGVFFGVGVRPEHDIRPDRQRTPGSTHSAETPLPPNDVRDFAVVARRVPDHQLAPLVTAEFGFHWTPTVKLFRRDGGFVGTYEGFGLHQIKLSAGS